MTRTNDVAATSSPPSGLSIMRHDVKAPNDGVVLAVRCSMVDWVLDCHAPAVHTQLRAKPDNAIAIEVLSQSDSWRVRGIALITTHGLTRDMPLSDNGVLRRAPGMQQIRGRMRINGRRVVIYRMRS